MDTSKDNQKGCIPVRYKMLLLSAGGTFLQMMVKLSLSVAIVAMVNSSPASSNSSSHNKANSTIQRPSDEFDWSSTMQGFVLSAFFYGYITTQVLSGWLAGRFGAKVIMGCSIGCAGTFTLLGPLSTTYGAYGFAASRILAGACTGMFFAPQQYFISKWIPPEEYQKISGLMNCCAYVSTVVTMSCTGLLSNYSWRLVFYVYGSCAVLWSVLWLCLAYESPEQHPSISHEEFAYITTHAEKNEASTTKKLKPVPWLSIITCVPVWAQMFVQISGAYLTYTLANEMPTYLKNILHFDVQNSGIISSLPYVFGGFSCTFFGFMSQWLQAKGILSRIAAYKIFNGIFSLGAATCMFLVSIAEGNKTVVVMLLVSTVIFYNAYCGGSYANMMDLALNYVGVLTGIMQTFANATGFISAQVVGLLTEGQQTNGQWAKVFYLAGGIPLPSFILYLFFGSVEEQEWNKQDDEETPNSETKKKLAMKKISTDSFPF